MADASYSQTSFIGGEISQWAQGQFDKPWYKTSLSKVLNSLISDEACITRRPGFRFLGTTRKGKPGRLLPFNFTQTSPYNLEFTDGFLRFWNDRTLVMTNDVQIVTNINTTVSPTIFTIPMAATWATGDTVIFSFNTPQGSAEGAPLLNRQFILTMLTTTTFTLVDATTNAPIDLNVVFASTSLSAILNGPFSSGPISDEAISGSPVSRTLVSILSPSVHHVYEIPTPYSVASHDWHTLRSVQSYNLSVFLQATVSPQALTVLTAPTATTNATFSFAPAVFQDGPYLDPPPHAIATPNTIASVIQVTVSYPAWDVSITYGINTNITYSGIDYISLQNNNTGNQPNISPTFWKALGVASMVNSGSGFVSTDLNRLIRLFSEPQLYVAATTYAAGDKVSYNGSYFSSLVSSNTGNQPDISLTKWVLDPTAAVWTWGIIITVNAPNQVTVQIQGAPLLYTTPIRVWRIGAWSNTTGWPTCGCYHEGRFWFAGAIPNRFDSSEPNQPFNMSPTEPDGTVTDANGITYTLNAEEQNPIFWMKPDHTGIIAGTQECEFLISSGGSGSPLSPSNIKAARETKYGSSNLEPVRTGLTLCFVKRYAKRLIEYMADIFSGRFYGPELSTNARHLTARNIEEVTFQEERIPVVWARCADGSLIGTTYRRTSMISTQPPEFNAWHQHSLGSNRVLESIVVGPSVGGTIDALATVTNGSNNIRFVEQLTSVLDETEELTKTWFLDSAVSPAAARVFNNNVIFGGLDYLEAQQVSVFAAGIDCGDYVVVNGQVTVPLGFTDPITGSKFDVPQFELLQPMAADFSDLSTTVVFPTITYAIPCVIGFNYQSQGQLCRPQISPDTGAKNGPGFGKKRRSARYAIQVVNSLGLRVGTSFNGTYPVPFNKVDAGGKNMQYLDTFSGITRETLKDDFSYDSQIAWQTTRPYPATITAFGAFIETQD